MSEDWLALREMVEGTPDPVARGGMLLDGQRNGPWRSLREDGTTMVRASFRRGRRHGLWTKWHENGAMAVRLRYLGGLADGPLEAWYTDGGAALHAELSRGLLHGPFTAWAEDRTRCVTGTFERGVVGAARSRRTTAPSRASWSRDVALPALGGSPAV